jgi:nicotinamide phosphoribosyltransferase
MARPLHLSTLQKTDSYKDSHPYFYKPGTTELYDYYSARGGEFSTSTLFGLQYALKANFEGSVVTAGDVSAAADEAREHFAGSNFNYPTKKWMRIVNVYGGRLPLEIKAVREGIPVPVSNVMMTIRNTDPECAFLTGWAETKLQHMWYGSAVATLSREVKMVLKEYLVKTADTLDALPFQLHDMGYRGVTSDEQAAIGGAAHLINFLGTDTKPANALLNQFYGAGKISGYSVPATEHSTTTSWGRFHEADAVGHALKQFPTGIISLVADSYDVYNFTSNIIGGTFRDQILKRKGKVVIRPDSGDFVKIIPELLMALAHRFGYRLNSKGYRVLSPVVGIIWSDGMNLQSIRSLMEAVTAAGWSTENVVVGMGAGLLQKVNRDTQKVAIKCSAAVINGEEVEVFKDPITDPGKSSLRGRQSLIYVNGIGYVTVPGADRWGDQLETVFNDGYLTRFQYLSEIRELAAI